MVTCANALAELVVQRTHLLAQHGHRHVVAHRADRFLLGFSQRTQHLLAFLARELEQLLEARQRLAVEGFGRERGIDQLGLQVSHALLEPALVRGARAVDAVDRLAVEHLAQVKIHRDHLARPELALGLDFLRRALPHAGLGRDEEVAVARAHPARRAQAVAIERARGVAAIDGDDAGRAVPRFGIERVVLVERGEVGVLVFQRLRRRRDQDAHRLQQVHAAGLQQLEHVVERLRIRAVHRDDRIELGQLEVRRAPHVCTRLRPRAVAGNGVDLAVVREQAERLRERPARRGVGRKTLVEHDDAGGQVAALQVRIELRKPVRQHHALVADARRGQADDVEVGKLAQALFGATAREEQRALEARRIEGAGGLDEDLLDARHRALGELAACVQIDRHDAPAGDVDAFALQLRGELVLRARRFGFIVRKEHQARGVMRAERDARLARERAKERVRLADQQAAAVAAESVGRDAAAMRHAHQRLDRAIDDGAAGRVVELRDQAEAARIALIAWVVETDRAGAVLLLHRRSIADSPLGCCAKHDNEPGKSTLETGELRRRRRRSARAVRPASPPWFNRINHTLCDAANVRRRARGTTHSAFQVVDRAGETARHARAFGND
ncbi:hypothetical protein ABIE51_000261 [Lysobacter sp. OAE881]